MTTALPARISSYLGGGLVTGFVGVFVCMAAWSAAQTAAESGAPAWLAFGGPFVLGAALLLALYVFLSTEYVAEVDADGIRFVAYRKVGPFRGAPHVMASARWRDSKSVREEVRVSRTKHGDLQPRYALRIDDATIDGGLLGTMQRDGKYLELVRVVETALGRSLPQQEIQD